jgi:hypothetical protein
MGRRRTGVCIRRAARPRDSGRSRNNSTPKLTIHTPLRRTRLTVARTGSAHGLQITALCRITTLPVYLFIANVAHVCQSILSPERETPARRPGHPQTRCARPVESNTMNPNRTRRWSSIRRYQSTGSVRRCGSGVIRPCWKRAATAFAAAAKSVVLIQRKAANRTK